MGYNMADMVLFLFFSGNSLARGRLKASRGRLAARGRLGSLTRARGTSLELASKLLPFFDFFGFSDGL